MSTDIVVWGAWLLAFVVIESLGLAHRLPRGGTTLSEFCWMIQRKLPLLRWVFLIGLAILSSHLVSGWPA